MSQHSLQISFYSGFVKPVNHYKNTLDKALSGFVIGAFDLSDCYLVVDIDCSYGNIALFLYVNNEVGKENGYGNFV